MGLAVLPARLRNEIAIMRDYITNGKDFDENEDIRKHKAWFEIFKDKYTFTPDNTEEILEKEIGATFERVLEDAGVYKRTPDGNAAFLRFIATIR
jgi:UDPglucose--hexose-1-phosphate uridylyltransferase